MIYRKSLDGPWICSWNCGFKSYDIKKVIEHENKGGAEQQVSQMCKHGKY